MNGNFNFAKTLGEYHKVNKVLYYGVVIDNVDEEEAKRIRVRVEGLDDALDNHELPYAFPLIPKNFAIKPKVNEVVLILIPDINKSVTDRFYTGSIIPQNTKLRYSDVLTAKSALNDSNVPLTIGSRKIPEAIGTFADGTDVIIEGRENAEIRFDKGEVLMRVGKHTQETIQDNPLLNIKNQTYIQLRHDVSLFDSDTEFSVTNIVSDKINLLTHENGSPRFNLNGGDNPIDDKALLKIMQEAHPLPFGDTLVEYLTLMRNVLLNHVHAYNGLKAINLNGEDSISKLLDFDLKTIVSKNIKIN